jgi:hypothetical protein
LYERKVRWRAYHDEEQNFMKENYVKAEQTLAEMNKQFVAEAAQGRVVSMVLEEAKIKYPGTELRVAALQALDKGDNTFRITRDALTAWV